MPQYGPSAVPVNPASAVSQADEDTLKKFAYEVFEAMTKSVIPTEAVRDFTLRNIDVPTLDRTPTAARLQGLASGLLEGANSLINPLDILATAIPGFAQLNAARKAGRAVTAGAEGVSRVRSLYQPVEQAVRQAEPAMQEVNRLAAQFGKLPQVLDETAGGVRQVIPNASEVEAITKPMRTSGRVTEVVDDVARRQPITQFDVRRLTRDLDQGLPQIVKGEKAVQQVRPSASEVEELTDGLVDTSRMKAPVKVDPDWATMQDISQRIKDLEKVQQQIMTRPDMANNFAAQETAKIIENLKFHRARIQESMLGKGK